MDKERFYNELKAIGEYSILNLKWNRINGDSLERLVFFKDFDKKDKPMLYTEEFTRLDIEKIGGYDSIISIKPESMMISKKDLKECIETSKRELGRIKRIFLD